MTETIGNSRIKIEFAYGSAGLLISSVTDMVHDHEWLYSDKSITMQRSPEKSFDEQYSGGMEFLFPGDEEEIFKNRRYRDHGQLWRIPFLVYKEKDAFRAVGLDESLGITAAISVSLREEEIFMRAQIENNSSDQIPFLFRLHPAFLFGEDTSISLNAEKAVFEEGAAYCNFVPEEDYPISNAENPVRLKDNDIFFHTAVTKGEFIVREGERSFRLEYERDKLPFLTYCSFRKDGRRIGILEPANAPGVSLASIAGREKVPVLKPKEKITCDFRITLQ